jgi:predicted acyltransferase
LQIYAVRIGANVFQVALLSSAPALVNVLLGLQAGHWLANKPLNRITFVTALWHRAGYLLLVPLPWLLAPAAEAWAPPTCAT